MTKDYCLSCGKEMRKWIADIERDDDGNPIQNSGRCVSMCINQNCNEWGKIRRAIADINNFKINF